jgi:hypothetical protein
MIVHTVGEVARELLACSPEASVMGITSRGLFLGLASGWVVFISREAHPGPLTLNLSGDDRAMRQIEIASPVTILPGWIIFPGLDLRISIQGAATWRAPPVPAGILPAGQRKARLEKVARQLLAGPKTSLLSTALPALLGFEGAPVISENSVTLWVACLQEALGEGRIPAIIEGIDVFLGLGGGLTPSGDDLVAGLLLALNRWGAQLALQVPVEELNQAVLPRAYRKTTRLSANLIECAVRGLADARLLLALDGILAGSASLAACADSLAGWGNTSGMDALAGMALVLAG